VKKFIRAFILVAIIYTVLSTFHPLTTRGDSKFLVYLPLIASGTPTLDSTPQPDDPTQKRAEVIAGVNAERAKAGCAPVVENASLTGAAQAWTDYLVQHNVLAHSSTVDFNWYTNHGYTATDWVSEAVASGQKTGAEVIADWMDDEPHRVIVLQSCTNTTGTFHAGVGYNANRWTLAIGELHD
jgi:uncharacterized protein YkwD